LSHNYKIIKPCTIYRQMCWVYKLSKIVADDANHGTVHILKSTGHDTQELFLLLNCC